MDKIEKLLKGSHILIVDDIKDNVYALSAFLDSYEVNVESAGSGNEALKLINEKSFDVILMDIRMPEMDGFEVIRQIRSNPKTAGIPIVAVTAQAMPGDAEKCMQKGADDYIAKPINTDILVEKLGKILGNRG